MGKLFNIDTEDTATESKGKPFKKADAFFNIYLPSNTDSGKKKLHAIPLHKDDEAHAALIQYVTTGDEARQAKALKNVLNQFIMDFVTVDNTKAKAGFSLPSLDD